MSEDRLDYRTDDDDSDAWAAHDLLLRRRREEEQQELEADPGYALFTNHYDQQTNEERNNEIPRP